MMERQTRSTGGFSCNFNHPISVQSPDFPLSFPRGWIKRKHKMNQKGEKRRQKEKSKRPAHFHEMWSVTNKTKQPSLFLYRTILGYLSHTVGTEHHYIHVGYIMWNVIHRTFRQYMMSAGFRSLVTGKLHTYPPTSLFILYHARFYFTFILSWFRNCNFMPK